MAINCSYRKIPILVYHVPPHFRIMRQALRQWIHIFQCCFYCVWCTVFSVRSLKQWIWRDKKKGSSQDLLYSDIISLGIFFFFFRRRFTTRSVFGVENTLHGSSAWGISLRVWPLNLPREPCDPVVTFLEGSQLRMEKGCEGTHREVTFTHALRSSHKRPQIDWWLNHLNDQLMQFFAGSLHLFTSYMLVYTTICKM